MAWQQPTGQQQQPPRARMTYGGGAPTGQQQEAARAELLQGAPTPARAPPAARPPLAKEDLQYMNNAQVMEHAVDQHKETTAAARRALAVVEQTKELQASTIGALQDQGNQMNRIGRGMEQIGTDLTYSQRMLRYMSMCCCVGFFCSSCVEPERTADDRKWRSGGNAPRPPPPGARAPAPAPAAAAAARPGQKQPVRRPGQQGQQGQGQQAGPQYPGVTTAGLEEAGFGEQAAVIREETRQQDQYLDQISQGLDQLKHGALVMQDELKRQENTTSRLHMDANMLQGKLTQVNREGFRNL